MGYRQSITVKVDGRDLTATNDELGVDFIAESVLGWFGGAPSTLQVQQNPAGPGGFASADPQYGSQSYTLQGTVSPTNVVDYRTAGALLDAAEQALLDAVPLQPVRMEVTRGGITRWAMVQRQDKPEVTPTSDWESVWTFVVTNADGRKFGDPLTATTGLPSVSGGLAIPFTLPAAINATVVSGQCFLTNPAPRNAPPGPLTLRIVGQTGGLIGPMVTHATSGLSLVFSSSMQLGAGDWLDVDMENETVLLNGQAARNGYVISRDWFGLDPGVNQFSFAAVSGNGQLTVTGTPAW